MTQFSLKTALFLLAAGSATTLNAQTALWLPPTGNWNDPANWSTGAVPNGPGSFATVNNGGTAVLSADAAGVPQDVIVADGAGTTGRVDHLAGSLSTSGWAYVGQNGGTGTYNLAKTDTVLAPGAFTGFDQGAGSLTVPGRVYVGGSNDGGGIGLMNINTTGTVAVSEAFRVGERGMGTLNIDSGTITAGAVRVAEGGTGTLRMGGGTVTADVVNFGGGTSSLEFSGGTLTTRTFELGKGGTAMASAVISGGVINVTKTAEGQNFMTIGSDGGVAVVNQLGGEVNINNGGLGGGAWLALATGAGADGTAYNLGGGSLNTTGLAIEVGADRGASMNVTGTGVLNAGGDISLGHRVNGVGTLNVFDSGVVNVNGTLIAAREGSGTINLSGPNARIVKNGGDTWIGNAAGKTGTLNIVDGGKFTTNAWIRIGREAGSNGEVFIDGPGSNLTQTTGDLEIGLRGTGAMTVRNGAGVFRDTGNWTVIGRENGGNGTLNLETGASFQNQQGRFLVGGDSGATGQVFVRDAGTVLDVNEFFVGGNGTGTVTQEAGSVIARGTTVIGENSVGDYVLNGGTFAKTTTSGDFLIGANNNARGTLTVNGGSLTTNAVNSGSGVYIGNNSGSEGTLNINGGNVTASGWAVILGNNGRGDGVPLTVPNSKGTINMSAGVLDIAGTPNAQNVNDSPDFLVGRFGDGVVNQTGGTINSTGWTVIGVDPTGSGAWNMSGDAVANIGGQGFTIGRVTSGTLSLSGNSVLNTNSRPEFGTDNGGVGTLIVSENAVMNFNAGNEFDINFGQGGTGIGHFIQSGGTVNAAPAAGGVGGRLRLGGGVGTAGDYQLSGGTASFASVTIGDGGTGFVRQTGGTINATQWLEIGQGVSTDTGPVPRYEISGGTYNGATIGVGSRRAGEMLISGTASVNPNEFIVGLYGDGDASGNGSVTQDGGTLTTNSVILGNQADTIGFYTMTGGTMQTNGNGSFEIGSRGGTASFLHSGGTVNVRDINLGDGTTTTPTLTTSRNLVVGVATPELDAVNARGMIRVRGGTVSVDGELRVAAGGIVEMSGDGFLNINNGSLGGTQNVGAVNVFGGRVLVDGELRRTGSGAGMVNVGDAALLEGAGVVSGPVNVLAGGSLSPGNGLGTLTTGTFNLFTDAHFTLQIGGRGLGEYDQLNVLGEVALQGDLAGSSFRNGFDLAGDGDPNRIQVGDIFYVILNDGVDAVSGTFFEGSAPIGEGGTAMIAGVPFTVSYQAIGGADGVPNDVSLVSQIPEPGAFAAMVAGVGMLLGLQRFRGRARA